MANKQLGRLARLTLCFRRSAPRRSTSATFRLEALEDRTTPSAALVKTFAAMDISDSGLLPSDANAAVGPAHVVEVVNNSIAAYSKSGAQLMRQRLWSLMNLNDTYTLIDPIVLYDNLAGRFVLETLDTSDNNGHKVWMAVSNTADPTEGWSEYHGISFAEDWNGNHYERPSDGGKVVYNRDAFVLMFPMGDHSEVIVIPKKSALDADNATFQTYRTDLANGPGSPVATHDAAAGAPLWFVDGSGTQLHLTKLFNPAGGSILRDNLSTQTYDIQLNHNAGRGNFIHDMWGGKIATAYEDGSSIRWAVIDVNRLHIVQEGAQTITGSNTLRYESIGMAPNGTLGLAYQTEPLDTNTGDLLDGTLYSYVTGRWSSDPPGTMPGPVLVAAKPVNAGDNHPGDYSAVAWDSKSGTFWTAVQDTPGYWTSEIAQYALVDQPETQIVKSGEKVKLTSKTTLVPTPPVQWQVRTDSGEPFENIQGAASSTFSFTANDARDGLAFRAVFQSALGAVNSHVAALTVTGPPQITIQPKNQTVAVNGTGTFTVVGSAKPAATVQWQKKAKGGATFADIAGANSTSLTLPAVQQPDSGSQYQAVFTNVFGATTSKAATLTVDVPPQITTQPQPVTASAGKAVTFKATANGMPAPTAQWQVSTDGGAHFSDIKGAKAATLTFVGQVTRNGDLYRAIFTNPVGTATTSAVALTVTGPPVVITQPVSRTAALGGSATFTADAKANPAATVQWQKRAKDSLTFADIPGATAKTLSLTNVAQADGGSQYQAVFTNTLGNATTKAATLFVTDRPVVTMQPSNQTVAVSGTPTFTAAAAGNPTPTVQWQVKAKGSAAFVNLVGATSPTLNMAAVALTDSGSLVRAVFTNPLGTATTRPATLTVLEPPTISLQPIPVAVQVGQTVTFIAAAGGSPAKVQWQVSTNGGTTFTNLVGATRTTLRFKTTAEQAGYLYRAVFTNAVGQATSDSAELFLF